MGSPELCIENGYERDWCQQHCPSVSLDTIQHGDSLQLFKCLKADSVDLIFADEPYNIAGTSTQLEWKAKKWRTINKQDQPWDVFSKEDFDRFHRDWITQAKRVLKPSGALWVSGTYHNIYKLGRELQDQGFDIQNEVVWYKRNGMPRSTPKGFTASHETLIWATKPAQNHPPTFHYDQMKDGAFPEDRLKETGKQMRSVWDIPTAGQESVGYATQKPTKLLERIILATSNRGDVVLDPFVGSGTTAVVAKNHCRHFIGFDLNPIAITKSTDRIQEVKQPCQFPT